MAENASSKSSRAKRNVKNRKTSTGTTGTGTGSSTPKATRNGSLTQIELPRITDFSKEPEVKTQVNSLVNYDSNSGTVAFEVPGIPSVNFDTVAGRVRFEELTQIDDVTKPGIKNKVDEKTFNKAKLEYEGGIRYQQLAQLSNKYVAEEFKTLTESYKAYAQGLVAIGELEKVKQKFLDVLKQQAVTGTKANEYIDAAHNLAISTAKLPYTVADREAKLSDPVSGSDEDYWDCHKVAINRTEARAAYDKFYEIYQGRKAKRLSTTPKLLGVFDEFDSEHSEEQHEKAQEIMGRIRHVGMHQILVGQSAEVGRNGWTWDAMKNCALLVLEGSIGSLRKHLTTDLGWTLKQKNQLGKEYDKYRKWADAENEANPDRPVENQTRLGLLIIGDRYQFLEIPIAHKGILRGTSAVTVRTEIGNGQIENKLTNQDNDSYKGNSSAKKGILESNDDLSLPTCPHCNSVNVNKKGMNAKGQQYYVCKDCTHKPRKWIN